MQKGTKDRLINIVSIGVAATSLVSGPLCVLLGPILYLSVRAGTRRLLYNDRDRLDERFWHMSQDYKKAAIGELARYGDARATEQLVVVMQTEVPELQLIAARCLSDIGDDRARAFMLGAIVSANSTLRKAAAQLLVETGWSPQTTEERLQQWLALGDYAQPIGQGSDAVAALVKAFGVNRTDAAARTDIVLALAGIGTPEVIDPLLQRMEHDESRGVRSATDRVLSGLVHNMTDVQRSKYTTLSTQLAQQRVRKPDTTRSTKVNKVDQRTEKRLENLYTAICKDSLDDVRHLLSSDILLLEAVRKGVEERSHIGSPALHTAVWEHSSTICSFLLDMGVSPIQTDSNNRKPLEVLTSKLLGILSMSMNNLGLDRKVAYQLLYCGNPESRTEVLNIVDIFSKKGAEVPNDLREILDVWKQES